MLFNRSVALPLGVLEEVLVRLNDMIFPANFYILDMENESFSHGSILILGRLLLMTTRTMIDAHVGNLSMEFGDDIVHFNIFEAMRHLVEEHYVFLVDIIDVAADSVDICTYLLSDFFDFSNFDLGSFNYAYYDSNDPAIVCSICAKISSAIHFDCVVGAGLESAISLPPATNLPFPSTI